ncbi:hypothetical protein [Streptomyces rochei]|uniref:hypothetical protein n=1 Tax=Streptomyces rochei TaxID=1928 RepID=UPI0036FB69A1
MLSLHIPAANAAIFTVSLVVGYLVYRHSTHAQVGTSAKGDLGMALGAVATCVVVLAFLFGLGDGKAVPSPASTTTPSAPVSSTPTVRE